MAMRLIIGLGNPGDKYQMTRHNLGFMVVKRVQERSHLQIESSSFHQAAVAVHPDNEWAVAMPMTFMNRSGSAVKALVERWDVAMTNLLVIVDDFHLPFARIRLRPRGSEGGHNGLASVIEHLGTDEFSRLRMGIGQPKSGEAVVDYVLGRFDKEERQGLEEFVDLAADCALSWLKVGTPGTMERFNAKRKSD